MTTCVVISGGESKAPNKALKTKAQDLNPSKNLGSFPVWIQMKKTTKGIVKKNKRVKKNLTKNTGTLFLKIPYLLLLLEVSKVYMHLAQHLKWLLL